jgi:hypothetical protein
MADAVRTIRVFVSSPGDVVTEIARLREVFSEINESLRPHGASVQLLRWETDAVPGAGRPQSVIAESVGDYDIFLGIMWKRFGTPSGKADSGTEEEFNSAYESFFKSRRPQIMFYFSHVPYVISDKPELKQLGKVLAFRDSLRKYAKALTWTYNTVDEFGQLVRRHLFLTVVKMIDSPALDSGSKQFLLRIRSDPRNADAVRTAAGGWLSVTKEESLSVPNPVSPPAPVRRAWGTTAAFLGIFGGILSVALLLNQFAASRSVPPYLLQSGNPEVQYLDTQIGQMSAHLARVKAEAYESKNCKRIKELSALAHYLSERIADDKAQEAKLVAASK